MKEQNYPHLIDVYIGNKLRIKRLEINWSQERLGKEVNLTFQQIQKYERGINRISCSKLYELARALEIEPNYFFIGLEKIEKVKKNLKSYEFQITLNNLEKDVNKLEATSLNVKELEIKELISDIINKLKTINQSALIDVY